MTHHTRPIPAAMTVAELDESERLTLTCRRCGRVVDLLRAYLDRRPVQFPPTLRLADIVTRGRCEKCGGRAAGVIASWPRSGAESNLGRDRP